MNPIAAFAKLKIFDHECGGHLQFSLCTEELFNTLSKQYKINTQSDFFQGYGIGNQTIEINSSVCLATTLNHIQLNGKFFIVSHSVPPIVLGIDYINK